MKLKNNIFFCIQGLRRPKVIVDLFACLGIMYANLDMICGGQGKVYEKQWAIFIKAFESAGIELVFVADGPSPECKHDNWVKKQYDLLEKVVNPVFDRLVSDHS